MMRERAGKGDFMTGRRWIMAGSAAALMMSAMPAQAGVFGDSLARCLVTAAKEEDRSAIMKWLFAAMAANPQIAPMAKVTPADREDLTRRFAQISERLLTDDCRSETVQALRNEGPGVIEAGFRVLGEAAMRGLMSDPATSAALGGAEIALLATFPLIVWGSDELRRWLRRRADARRAATTYGASG